MASVERMYVAAYMAAHWPEGGYTLGVNLGPLPPELVKTMGYQAAAQLAWPWRPEVDAVRWSKPGLIMIEAKAYKFMDVFAKLVWYGSLIPQTEEMREWWGQPNQLRVVVPEATDVLRTLADQAGIVVDVWSTPELEPHLARYRRYWGKDYQIQRQLELQKLAELGFEPRTKRTILG